MKYTKQLHSSKSSETFDIVYFQHYRVYKKKLDTLVKPSQIIILWYKYESCSWICSLGSTQSDDIMSNDNISRLSEHWPF